jgi:TPP-dependent pyruvate/acetoin dehydrogenase alpha subunit
MVEVMKEWTGWMVGLSEGREMKMDLAGEKSEKKELLGEN